MIKLKYKEEGASMWNRQQVKEQAKLIMKRNYWKMFVVTLLTGILTGEKTTIIERIQDFASNNLSYDAQPIFYSSNFQYIFYSFTLRIFAEIVTVVLLSFSWVVSTSFPSES